MISAETDKASVNEDSQQVYQEPVHSMGMAWLCAGVTPLTYEGGENSWKKWLGLREAASSRRHGPDRSGFCI